MNTLVSIRNKLLSFALTGVLSAVPAFAQTATGGGGGRWVESSPRTTFLRGFLSSAQGKKLYTLEAAMIADDAATSGGFYGEVHPLLGIASPTPVDDGYLLYGDYKRNADGSGSFEAVVMLQVWSKNIPLMVAVGVVHGELARAIPEPIGLAPAPANVHLGVRRATKPVADADRSSALIARIRRARTPGLVNSLIAKLERKVIDAKQALFAPRHDKGAFRVRWTLSA
jgi:hypothetical protein